MGAFMEGKEETQGFQLFTPYLDHCLQQTNWTSPLHSRAFHNATFPSVEAALFLLHYDFVCSGGYARPQTGERRGLYHLIPLPFHILCSSTLPKQGYFILPDCCRPSVNRLPLPIPSHGLLLPSTPSTNQRCPKALSQLQLLPGLEQPSCSLS